MRAIIVSGGKPPSKELLLNNLNDKDFIIGVDKGCNTLYENGIIPNIIVGDFDSVDNDVLEFYKEKNVLINKFRTDKDYSDTDLGYEKAKECGATEILLFGATGNRLDHMLGNIGILFKALKDKIDMKIIDDNNKIFLIDKSTKLKGKYGDLISFHAMSDIVTNINIKNARYSLANYNMSLLEPRAICNEFLNEDIEITFDEGKILVLYSTD